MNLELTSWPGQLASELWEAALSQHPLVLVKTVPSFYMGTRRLTSGPQDSIRIYLVRFISELLRIS